ncbi:MULTISPECIES: response regulator transcription factor [Streptomyces]|uniref:Response regulator transcription factor n=1 Tax=Streptomyces solicathayae TaxID=3081768 RepID=A0ABZ0LS83_9ACTN|nr:response regulator transcription factor [Streptomyces sp. HUAS YS2]WOX22071.1 response regulator transcription factor [Streptomyces sp. HUAS YS2]
MTEPVRVLIADDQALLRGSFRVLIDATPGMTVVGEAEDGARTVELARTLRPDVVLMDLRMPVMDGIEATRAIRADETLRGVRVLALTMFDTDEYAYPALRAGASGFLLKDATPNELITGIRIVAAGESVLAATTTTRLISTLTPPPTPRPRPTPLPGLTTRETEVLVQIANGLSNAEIAATLQITLPTVKTHVSTLLTKLQARDRTQLAIIAYETNHAEPGFPT